MCSLLCTGCGLPWTFAEWVEGWLSSSVYSSSNWFSSIKAWFSDVSDFENDLFGTGCEQLHVLVADVLKSFDTVDRFILDCTLGRFGLPDWFHKASFSLVIRLTGLSWTALWVVLGCLTGSIRLLSLWVQVCRWPCLGVEMGAFPKVVL